MKVDLFTFIAQIVNFIILVILLYYFLFKKIIRAIDQREETMRKEFEEAKNKREEAEQTIVEHKNQLNALDAQKEAWIKEAQTQAREERERLLEEARHSILEKKKEWSKKLEGEKTDFLKTLQEKIAEEVYSIAESVVTELANVELQKMLYQRFLKVMEGLSEEEMNNFRNIYFQAKEKEIKIFASFELSDKEKGEIEQILNRILEAKPEISFHSDSLGISLKLAGFQLNWTSKNYFEKLEKKFEKVLAETND
jgi:F-type H+-transporting ATPase subunit b